MANAHAMQITAAIHWDAPGHKNPLCPLPSGKVSFYIEDGCPSGDAPHKGKKWDSMGIFNFTVSIA